MKKLKSQVVEGHWSTDWWEIAEGVKAIVRTSPEGRGSILVRAGSPSPLHKVNSSLPLHWQKSQSTDITRTVAAGSTHNLTHLLRKGGIAMQADGAEEWLLEVDIASVESTLNALAENYGVMAAAASR
jgi:hypothetical protein